MARPSPLKRTVARAGNYVAPVDTAGMDPEMKATLSLSRPKPKQPGLGDTLRKMFGGRKRKG